LSGQKQILTWEEESEHINKHSQIDTQDSQRDLEARAYEEDTKFAPVSISEYELPAGTTSELAELSLAIQEGITNLFELSMIIRKRPEKDDYIKASLRYNFDPKLDINHVPGHCHHETKTVFALQERAPEALRRSPSSKQRCRWKNCLVWYQGIHLRPRQPFGRPC
jgi:hypothetical protein